MLGLGLPLAIRHFSSTEDAYEASKDGHSVNAPLVERGNGNVLVAVVNRAGWNIASHN